jgi:hypothetical protein
MDTITIFKKNGGQKPTLTEKMDNLEEMVSRLSNVIKEREEFANKSLLYCKKNSYQNNKLSFIIDAYNNSYMRIIDDKIQQMQQLAKLEGYLNKMIHDGNYEINDIQRAKEKQREILNNINETRSHIETIEKTLAISV